ncbi:MAG: hypothetical protein R3D26_18540 [Cyanobacteriota/Melainabacteria group bacterium]
MAQPQPEERITLDQVLKLVDKLSPEEQEQLRKKLSNKTWGQQFRQLAEDIERDRIAKGLPRLSEEEIMAEVKAVREEMKAERVRQSQSSN